MKKTTAIFNRWKSDLLHVFYPGFCFICDTEMSHSPGGICPVCENDLHYTFFEGYQEPTPLDRIFWGRVPVHQTYALLYFLKQQDTQAILHALKYRNRPDVATYFGECIGEKVAQMRVFDDLDALVPVPLHPKKEFVRGYNQSEKIADGVAAVLGKPVRNDLLKRVVFTESQTKKGRLSRWENMQQRFEASRRNHTSCRHVAIVDDVVTTGSTIETCIRLMRESLPETRISVISLAMAK